VAAAGTRVLEEKVEPDGERLGQGFEGVLFLYLGLTRGLGLLQLEGLEFLGCGSGGWFFGAAVEGGGGGCVFGGGEELGGGRRGGGARERRPSGSGEVGDVLEKGGRMERGRGRLVGIHCTGLFLSLPNPKGNGEKKNHYSHSLF